MVHRMTDKDKQKPEVTDEGGITSSTAPSARREGETWAETVKRVTGPAMERAQESDTVASEPLTDPWGEVYDDGNGQKGGEE